MRNLPPRPTLAPDVERKLQAKTRKICRIANPQEKMERARTLYNSARGSNWFRPVINALRSLCGHGELCMYCSSNEPSQVEHYRPLSVFPEQALEYKNYLWACDICNRHKGDRFPPDTASGERILNPLEDQVWDYFFLDEKFGRLMKRTDPTTGEDLPRAVSTCAFVDIDRENVQIKRQKRLHRLRRDVQLAFDNFENGSLTDDELRSELAELRADPFQADVADYFLNGPGREHEPFRSALAVADKPSA